MGLRSAFSSALGWAAIMEHDGSAGLTGKLDDARRQIGLYHGRKMMPLSWRCAFNRSADSAGVEPES